MTTFDFDLVKRQPRDFRQINLILQRAYKTTNTARKNLVIDPETAFNTAYEAMLKTTLALMLSRGLRPKIRLGHHKTLVSYSQDILGAKFEQITSTYNKMRKKRNSIIYDSCSISLIEAKNAVETSEKYFGIIESKIVSDNPQQKLWRP